ILARFYTRDGLDVVVSLMSWERRISLGGDQSDRRIVDTLFVTVLISLNGTFGCFASANFPSGHVLFTSDGSESFVGTRDSILQTFLIPAGYRGPTTNETFSR